VAEARSGGVVGYSRLAAACPKANSAASALLVVPLYQI
jgi:hypothetical protein